MIEAFQLFGEISLRGGQAVQQGLNNVSQTAERTSGRMGSFGKAMLGIGTTMAGSQMASGFLNVAGKILEVTDNMNAMNSQYTQVLGSMKGTADKYITEMGAKWGKHPNDVKSALMQYYAILKGKGLSEKDAYATAQKYLTMTVDGNAFANEDMSSTTERFMGMIKGEYDSVDTAMVNMSQTMLNDESQKEYGKKWDKLSQAQQEALKTSIAMKQQLSAGVTGQAEREAGSYANRVAYLNNQWKTFIATIGNPVIGTVSDIFAKVGSVVQKLGDYFTSLSPDTQQFIVIAVALSVGLTAVGLVVGGLIIGFMSLATSIGVTAGALALATGGLILVIPLIVAGVMLIIKHWDLIKAKTLEVWNWIWDKIKAFGNWFLHNTAIGYAIQFVIKNWDSLKKATQIMWDMVKALFQVGIDFIKKYLGPIASWVKGVFDKVKSGMEGPMNSAKTTMGKIASAIKSVFEKLHITIPKPKIPSLDVTTGHKKIGNVDVPYPKFHLSWKKQGGYFDSATLFGAGESGREVIMPIENKKYMKPFSTAVAENLRDIFSPLTTGAAGGVSTLIVPLNVNGREIARAMITNIDQELKRQKELRRRGV